MSVKNDELYRRDYLRYAVGYIGAMVIVYLMYFAVTQEWLGRVGLAVLLLVAASLQLLIQLAVFLHVGVENKPRWTMWSIIYTVAMMLVLVVGSIWVMANMNYNMHYTPEQMNDYMLQQNRKGF